MKERVFFDTGAIYAYMNIKDPDHERIKAFLSDYKGKLVMTNYIFDEIITLVLSRLGHKKACFVGNTLLNSAQIEKIWVTQNEEKVSWKLFSSRTDKEYSFTDCISFIVMRRFKIKQFLATDDNFRQEGFEKA